MIVVATATTTTVLALRMQVRLRLLRSVPQQRQRLAALAAALRLSAIVPTSITNVVQMESADLSARRSYRREASDLEGNHRRGTASS